MTQYEIVDGIYKGLKARYGKVYMSVIIDTVEITQHISRKEASAWVVDYFSSIDKLKALLGIPL